MRIQMDGIEVMVLAEDKYLQINNISGTDLARLWDKIQESYGSYDKWLCFRNVTVPTSQLTQIGATIQDDCIEMNVTPDMASLSPTQGVERITEATFEAFARHHDTCHPDMYWTGERLRPELSKWGIFCTRTNGHISGYVLLNNAMRDPMEGEIFCIQAEDVDTYKALFSAAINCAFESGKSHVLYMADGVQDKEGALGVGFTVEGFYQGYLVPGQS